MLDRTMLDNRADALPWFLLELRKLDRQLLDAKVVNAKMLGLDLDLFQTGASSGSDD